MKVINDTTKPLQVEIVLPDGNEYSFDYVPGNEGAATHPHKSGLLVIIREV
ncbi:hypothetical protein [Methanococcus maripaludis]|uniref:Uncharacterized protein n=2 Tax=Methanococcus maripaludis TaxID=39152 RepID=A0A7J9S0T5_METMI|nr:hypothetical protein [Methanococcus maripaludis]MBB6067853.1 hypothetical protein [Methanococcus maripaludis]